MKKIITIIALTGIQTAFAQLTNIINFDGVVDGKSPYGNVILQGGFLYGMTSEGGTNDLGIIYKVMPDGTGYQKLLDFSGSSNGSEPLGSLVSDGTNLFGMTSTGGANNAGTIFKIGLNGSGFTKLLDLVGATTGSNPKGSLLLDGSTLYGMTSLGGANNFGTIFSISTSGSFTKLLDFDGTNNGSEPIYSLHLKSGFLFGMTQYGGANGIGTIFKIMTNGSGYAKLHDFNGSDGNAPIGGFTSDASYLYGITESGGTNNHGVIFKIMTDGTGFTKLHDFNSTTTGRFPRANPVLNSGKLYGLTQIGGANNLGVLYSINTNGTSMTRLVDFAGISNGSSPEGALIYDGSVFYGTTRQGGANFGGTLFKYAPSGSSASIDENESIEITLFPNPSSDIVTISGENLDQFSEMTVYAIDGKEIYSKSKMAKLESINTSDWNQGIYFINFSNNEISKTLKFEKN